MKFIKNIYSWGCQHPRTLIFLPIIALVSSVCFVQILDKTQIKRKKPIEYIIVHYTANNSESADAKMNAIYLRNKHAAGTHYCVDDTDVIQCTKEDMVAYAIGDAYWKGFTPKPWLLNPNGTRRVLNHNSLSYEMCLGGSRNDSIIIETTAQMVGWQLVNKGLDISRVLRHHDVTGKPCPKFFYDGLKWQQEKEDSMFNVFLGKVKHYQMIHIERKRLMKSR